MLKNYFITALRNVRRQKGFTVINLTGLALGLTCSLLIVLWVQDERSVDGFHTNGSQLYQVYERHFYDGKVEANYSTQGLLADELKRKIPEIQYASSLEEIHPYTFKAGDKITKMEGSYAGVDFFRMFSYPLLQGTPETALNAPQSIAISRKMAEFFFGSPEKAIGKTIRFENKDNLKITAVFENLPANSSRQFDFAGSWKGYVDQNAWINNWRNTSPSTYVQLRPGTNPANVGAKIRDFVGLYASDTKEFHTELYLQPYSETYLHSTFKNGRIDGGRIDYVHLFSLVAAFILLIACINFMNLATARSAKRAREVGVRKVIGASRPDLIGQFVGEAILLTAFSIIISLVLVGLFIPTFNSITGKQLSLPVERPAFWGGISGLLVLTGLVVGSYPALYLSSLNPIRVLSGSLKFGRGTMFFRKGLVVFQFTLAIALIAGVMVIYRQMEYVQTKNLGYDRENLLYVPIEGELISKYKLFKEETAKIPGIQVISKIKESPTVINHTNGDLGWTGKDPGLNTSFSDVSVGYDFVKTMKLQLKEGRDFSRDFNDSDSYILNEAAVKKIGYQDPVGKPVWWSGRQGKIIGVLKDFHFNSMHQNIEPLVVRLNDSLLWGTILVRTEAGKTKGAIAGLEKIYKELNPNFSFTYQFSDQEYAKLYNSEQVVSKLVNYFAFLAIFISCLGLFGLTTFTAGQRAKEIGVRKVLGASVPNIITLLLSDFLKPVAISILIAFPISWYAMNRWLQGFAYKIDVGWWVLGLAALLTVGIAVLTVSFQSIKVAIMNPVKSLKSE